MIKIYGSPLSSAGRCYWAMEEMGVPYERVKLNMTVREHKSESYLKLNPNGKVPTLIDGKFILWESVAINFYLAEKFQPELLGESIEERALVQQWSVWAMADLQPPHVDVLIQKVFVPEDKRDYGLIERSLKAIGPKLEILERHLSERRYVVDEKFTMADINLATVVYINQAVHNDISQFKAIEQWLGQLSQRPARQRHVKMER